MLSKEDLELILEITNDYLRWTDKRAGLDNTAAQIQRFQKSVAGVRKLRENIRRMLTF